MHRNYLLISVLAILMAACSKDRLSEEASVASPEQEPMSRQAINDFVLDQLEDKAIFRWDMASDQMLWSALSLGRYNASIGYQPAGFTQIKDKIHQIDVQSAEWRSVRDRLVNYIVAETNRLFPGQSFTAQDLLTGTEDGVLPVFDITILHPELVRTLRAMPELRYLEPIDYSWEEIELRSDSGCGYSPDTNIPTADYTNTTPNAKISWHQTAMNIPNGWNTSKGAGITVCLIDTGTSPNQANLNGSFASGESTGRFIDRLGTYPPSAPDGPNDQCGHGTQMAGLIAAPRASGGAVIGTAYQANLVAIRATQDVVLNTSDEKNGVKNALIIAGNRPDVKVISMSIGDVFYSSTVADGIYYAYNNGKLIMAAAGTSLSWTSWWGVIFPANMAEAVAVTGVKDGSTMVRCNTCHSGGDVDFVVTMQRTASTARTALTLALTGNTPARVGGSSAATATAAGIAAMVWATNPNQTREQVMNRLKTSASFYPGRNSQFGWGRLNAQVAVQ